MLSHVKYKTLSVLGLQKCHSVHRFLTVTAKKQNQKRHPFLTLTNINEKILFKSQDGTDFPFPKFGISKSELPNSSK